MWDDEFRDIVYNFIVALENGEMVTLVQGSDDEEFTYGALCVALNELRRLSIERRKTTHFSTYIERQTSYFRYQANLDKWRECNWILSCAFGTSYVVRHIDNALSTGDYVV